MSGSASSANPISLLDLMEPRRWQRLQEHFSSVLGITIRTVSLSRELLVSPSWPPGLVPEQTVQLLSVGEELEGLLPIHNPLQDISSLTTTLGVTYAVVPIRATSQSVVAYFVVGPVMVGPREDELQFRQRVGSTGADAQALWSLLLSLKLYTFSGVRSVLNLMEEVGTSLAQFAYQAKQLSFIVPATNRLDHAVASYYTERVLHSLLEAATISTHAEGGSVMVYDAKEDALRIQVAEGLEETIVTGARLKRGEGLAGLAAAERSILLVDADTQDARLKNRMTRKELCSSLVAPLIPDSAREPIGVLSLRTSNSQKRFTKEHIELLKRLLDIAGVALSSLRTTGTASPIA